MRDRSSEIIFSPLSGCVLMGVSDLSNDSLPRFIVANPPLSAISANFIARLIKGCRGDVPAGCFA